MKTIKTAFDRLREDINLYWPGIFVPYAITLLLFGAYMIFPDCLALQTTVVLASVVSNFSLILIFLCNLLFEIVS